MLSDTLDPYLKLTNTSPTPSEEWPTAALTPPVRHQPAPNKPRTTPLPQSPANKENETTYAKKYSQ